jgi:hypothetical protein
MISNRSAKFALLALFMMSGETTALSASATEVTTRESHESGSLQSLCTPEVLRRYAPRGVTIEAIADLNPAVVLPKTTRHGVTYFPANALNDGAPEYCLVTGSVTTNAVTGKTANFGAAFPGIRAWSKRFLLEGCGGTCGDVFDSGPPAPSILRRGYAVWTTDDGHIDSGYADNRLPIGADTDWALKSPGKPDPDALIDYAYRAVHTVAVVGKKFTKNFYAGAHVDRSYFLGCSDGGKEGMREASLFPEDFDGIVAGAPFLDPAAVVIGGIATQLSQLRSPAAVLPARNFDVVAKAFTAKCDASDGVVDGIVQDPAACSFNPQKDIPKCTTEKAADDCLTGPQIDAVTAMFNSVRDSRGKVVAPGFATVTPGGENSGWGLGFWAAFPLEVSDSNGPFPFGNNPSHGGHFWAWPLTDGVIRNVTFLGDRAYNSGTDLALQYQQAGEQSDGSYTATISAEAAERISLSLRDWDSSNPFLLAGFISQNRKLLLWHGYADGLITPYSTVQYYTRLAALNAGYGSLQRNVRLFMAPDVGHCGVGGDGPNAFQTLYHKVLGEMPPPVVDADNDMLSALERWTEAGVPPTKIIASKYQGDDISKPVVRSMPLCPFPARARYDGRGDVTKAASWSCPLEDTSLLNIGESGKRAGL